MGGGKGLSFLTSPANLKIRTRYAQFTDRLLHYPSGPFAVGVDPDHDKLYDADAPGLGLGANETSEVYDWFKAWAAIDISDGMPTPVCDTKSYYYEAQLDSKLANQVVLNALGPETCPVPSKPRTWRK